jgi:hypothetical protein
VRTRAEAEQFRQEVVATGEAEAIRSVYSAINQSGTDERVIAIKYLETLQGIADGQATKIFVPADMSATLGAIGGIAEMLRGDPPNGRDGNGHDRSQQPPQVASASEPASVPAPKPSSRRADPPLPPQRDVLPPPAPGR